MLGLAPAFIAACAVMQQTPPLALPSPNIQDVRIRTSVYTPPSEVLRAETNLVEVGFSVRDGFGHAVKGFQQPDFAVFDNGKRQTITSFTEVATGGGKDASAAIRSDMPGGTAQKGSAPPRSIILLFDDVNTASAQIMVAVQAARKFVQEGLAPQDKISVVASTGEPFLDFSSDTSAITAAIDAVRSHARSVDRGWCPSMAPLDAYLILKNQDFALKEEKIGEAAQCLACDLKKEPYCRPAAAGRVDSTAQTIWSQMEGYSLTTLDSLANSLMQLKSASGARVIVFLSSGFITQPLQQRRASIFEAALKLNVAIHTLDLSGLDSAMVSLARRELLLEPLREAPEETGGNFFHNTNDFAGALRSAFYPETSYLLTFNPGGRDGKFHTLKVGFQGKKSGTIQYRPGYFSPAEDVKAKQAIAARSKMDQSVFTPDVLHEFQSAAKATTTTKDGQLLISVNISVNVNDLKFTDKDGRHFQQLVFLTTLLDTNGQFVSGKEAIMDLALTDARLASMKKDGLKAVITLSAPAGNYRVRQIVREGMAGALSAASIPIAAPQ